MWKADRNELAVCYAEDEYGRQVALDFRSSRARGRGEPSALSLPAGKGRTAAPPRSSGAALISTTAEIHLLRQAAPPTRNHVSADADGNVDAFLVDVGDEVFVGEALARIGASALESQREVAAAAATNAEGQVARAESMSPAPAWRHRARRPTRQRPNRRWRNSAPTSSVSRR